MTKFQVFYIILNCIIMEYNVLFALFRGKEEAKTERCSVFARFFSIIMYRKEHCEDVFRLLKALYRKIPQL
ncbi:MAG: hypothetical protein DBX39_01080 [Bacillota bacterium]|nr:MAG: hypothetical protein DBX39_01080 [Bacillota bacterium]